MSTPSPNLHTPSGCRSLAYSFRRPGDPFPILAQIAELDWMAEAWLIERESDSDVRYPETKAGLEARAPSP